MPEPFPRPARAPNARRLAARQEPAARWCRATPPHAAAARGRPRWVPLAVDGLSRDTLGQRFRVGEHPRFAQLLSQTGPTRFAADSGLPDPYDGLGDGLQGHLRSARLPGLPARIGGRPWGCSRSTRSTRRAASARVERRRRCRRLISLAAATAGGGRAHRWRCARAAARRTPPRRAHRQASGAGEPAPGHRRDGRQQRRATSACWRKSRSSRRATLTVLVTGETGVGKELVANALHAALSPRAGRSRSSA